MDIEFHTAKLRKACSSEKGMRKEWGERMAKRLKQRLADLEACQTLEDMRNLPGHCHELKGSRKGQLAVDLVHPQRLIFEPSHDPAPSNDAGGLEWKKVTSVTILGVVDYHD